MTSSARAWIVRRCLPVSSKASDRATARRSKTRSTGSQARTATRSFSSPRASTPTSSTRRVCRPACPSTSSWTWCAQFAGLKTHISPVPVCDRVRLFRSAQPQGQPGNQVDRRLVFSRDRSTVPRVTRGRRTGPAGGNQRGASGAAAALLGAAQGPGLSWRAGGRPDYARCFGTLPDVYQSRRVSPVVARRQRRPAPYRNWTGTGPGG
jgi:hypothetical protein